MILYVFLALLFVVTLHSGFHHVNQNCLRISNIAVIWYIILRLKENKPVESWDNSKPLFDVTGTFYWCPANPYEEAILVCLLQSSLSFLNQL
jgi:hypothetical protein